MMTEPQERRRPFPRMLFVWVAVAIIAALVVFGVLTLYMPYERERRVVKLILVAGGRVDFEEQIPLWIPPVISGHLPIWHRIRVVGLRGIEGDTDTYVNGLWGSTELKWLWLDHTKVSDTGLKSLSGLRELQWLSLEGTQITDRGLESLKELTTINELNLANTQITDAGLVYLTGLTKLESLDLVATRTTKEGRTKLSAALPNCRILPAE